MRLGFSRPNIVRRQKHPAPKHRRLSFDCLEDRRLLSAGQLDTSFGNGGLATAQIGGSSASTADAVAIQANGEMVTAGATFGPNFALARFTTAGALDSSFGSHGGVTTSFGKNTQSSANAVAIQPNGEIVAAGYVTTSSRTGSVNSFALARYNTNGTLDSTFGNKGLVTTSISDSSGSAMALYPNSGSDPADAGKILVVGSASSSSAAVAAARYNANGTLDTSFGNKGTEVISLNGYTNSAGVQSVALEPNGGFVVAVSADIPAGSVVQSLFVVAQFTESGALDTTFGSGGVVATQPDTTPINGHYSSQTTSVVIQPNGEIVAAGKVIQPLSPQPTGAPADHWVLGLVRYNANGSLDTSFGNGGMVVDDVAAAFTGTNSWSQLSGATLAIDADGNLIVGGSESDDVSVNGTTTFTPYAMVARYTSQGALDSTFGNGGVTLAPQSVQGPNALALYPSPDSGDPTDAGKIVLAGHLTESNGTSEIAVARYLGDPATTTTPTTLSASTPTSSSGTSGSTSPSGSSTAATDAVFAAYAYPDDDDALA